MTTNSSVEYSFPFQQHKAKAADIMTHNSNDLIRAYPTLLFESHIQRKDVHQHPETHSS